LRSFAARFSLSVFSGFFLVVFFESMPLLMIVLASGSSSSDRHARPLTRSARGGVVRQRG
jgi:hypothetical protein